LDQQPDLLFTLRKVDQKGLIASASAKSSRQAGTHPTSEIDKPPVEW